MKNKNILIIILVAAVLALVISAYFIFFRTFTVYFNSQMGTSISAVEVKKGEKVTKPNDPTYDGYTFEGWYLNDEEFDFDTPITESITLTGKWHQNN